MDSLLPFLYDSFIRSNMPVIPAFTPLIRLMASSDHLSCRMPLRP